MASTTNLRHTCGECTFRNHNYCTKSKLNVRPAQYACAKFMTDKEWEEALEKANNERARRTEARMNFLLTSMMIAATSTQMLLEYFDSMFQDHKVEMNWRFERKRAANEIVKACDKIRSLYQHSFMVDHNEVMTNHGKEAFNYKAYDLHEEDGRNWALKLLYHMDRCWQDPEKEQQVLDYYKSLPDNGCFDPMDYRHFITKRG